ncbi:TraR/DksA family transcriptional regulator [Rhizobium sp. CFBP 8762]|uniref:TraR/DksA family transcriptional regulator n=1 Tax=Rhizobium sp. CFBP 8762 TaxID=2775279 RepID=UPI00177FE2F3|nr:TraR/DksA family transcriptional regulator [Rhizobium sp. CFBP 8762]MBD8554903.1 TraR/DksA family transcriptional regulator [Rhizobium sp. CFBP 8762]
MSSDDQIAAAEAHIARAAALKIEAAHRAVSSIGYRWCCDCGVEISIERRAALPSARRCIDCQERHERKKRF